MNIEGVDWMGNQRLEMVFAVGETIGVEFKRCGNGIESDTYETVCSFLNRFGGDIYLGVEDNGNVLGLPEKSIPDMIKNFIKTVNNPNMMEPTVYLIPESLEYEGRKIVKIHVPPSSEVHRFKKVIYDRVDDSDVKITSTNQIAGMYIRKQNVFTEKKVYKHVKPEELRLDLLTLCRKRAVNKRPGHPWKDLDDMELLRSAGLYGEDYDTGDYGMNLAGIMLLGKDEVIRSICPMYKTDAILRKVNRDRYDDREIIKTNLIESYDLLMEFARKHLWDKFYLDNNINISLRDRIAREMLANTLIHREMTSPYIAKFVIERDRMYVENANRALRNGVITPENLEPNPKNPIIASFFNQIGYADELGSGTRYLFKYVKRYSGKLPEIIEGDVFRIIVPLDDIYSFDLSLSRENFVSEDKVIYGAKHDTLKEILNEYEPLNDILSANRYKNEPLNDTLNENQERNEPLDEPLNENPERNEPLDDTLNAGQERSEPLNDILNSDLTSNEEEILCIIRNAENITQKEISRETSLSQSTVKRVMKNLMEKGILIRVGSKRTGVWQVIMPDHFQR